MTKDKSNKINLVIFTIYYPPVISIASYRLEAFARYLDKKRFNITVICPETDNPGNTPEIESVNVIRLPFKPHPLKVKFSKNDTFAIHKLKALYNLFSFHFIHDEYKDWGKKAMETFKKINATQKTDIVISTFPTVAPHLVALKLKYEGFDFKWVADMRDEMSKNPFIVPLHKKYLEKVEKKLFEKVDLITTTTPSMVKDFEELSEGKVDVQEIRNGFDFEIPVDYSYNDVFTVSHTGTFYADIKPYTFLKAVRELLNENKLQKIKIVFTGAGKAVSVPDDLKEIVTVTGKIPHNEAVEKIKNADANLLVTPQSFSKSLQGKLYEYIATQKPVIALSGKGSEAEKFISRCNAGFVAEYNNIEDIKNIILKAYDLWKNRKRLNVDIEYFKQFHRKEQVKKLEKLILKTFDN